MFKKVFVVCVFVFSLFCMFSEHGNAQLTQTGSLNGTVMGPENHVLPGVQITITSPALMLPQMSTITNEKGMFRFPSLPPGTYKATFEMTGFKSMVQKGIIVSVLKTTTINVLMELSQITETVTVNAATPTVDKERTNAVTSLDSKFIQNVPAVRSLDALFAMAPGVVNDPVGGGNTVNGGSVRDNTYNLDGVNVTDPVTGTQGGTFNVMDIAEEVSIQTGGLSAEYSAVRGGVVNVVTKSGGNTFSGSASAYYRSHSTQSDNTTGTIFEGQKVGFNYEIEPSFTLGGPIIKDKIWFFTSYSFRNRETYVFGFPFDKQPTNIPVYTQAPTFFFKATTQLSKNDKLTLSFNFSDGKSNNRGASSTRNEDSTWRQTAPIYTYNAQLTHFFGNNLFVNVKGAYLNYHLNLKAKNQLPLIYDSVKRQTTQSYGYDDLYSRDRLQIMSDATTFVDNLIGRHEFKAGLEFEFSKDIRDDHYYRDSRNGLGYYFLVRNGVPRYVINYQDFKRQDKKFMVGGFLQDAWNPIERLTLNVGVRIDYQEGIIPAQGQDRTPITAYGQTFDPRVMEEFKPLKWTTIAPRLGLVYDLFGNGKTTLKATYNRYYAASIMQYFVTVNPNAFLTYYQNLDANWQPTGAIYNVSGQAGSEMDPNLKSPYVDELTIGIERELFKDWKVGIRYIKKWDRNLVEDVDQYAIDFAGLMAGQDITTLWGNYWDTVTVTDPYTGQPVTFYSKKDLETSKYVITNPPGANRNYNGIEVVLDKRFSGRWSMNASYVYARSKGLIGTDFDDSWSGQPYFDNPNWHINAYGDLELERRHQFKLTTSVMGPWGINLSAYYRYLSGTRYARVISSYDLDVPLNQPDEEIIYAEPRGSQKLPDLSILDLRVEKAFKLPGKLGRLSVFADVFNVFNAAKATDIQNRSSGTLVVAGHVVEYGGLTAIQDPRIIRIGAKYEF
ncbi:MAG: TonB-dependent receptor [Candidatus Omnitrophota bacterium]